VKIENMVKCNCRGNIFDNFLVEDLCFNIKVAMINIDFLYQRTLLIMVNIKKKCFFDFLAAYHELLSLEYCFLLLLNPN
jgi:hypothetical protein